MASHWPSTWSQEQVQDRRQDIEWRQSLLSESARDELLSKINFPESPSIYGPFGQVFLALSALPIKIGMIILNGEYHISWAIGYLRFGLLALDGLLCWLFYIVCQRNRQLLMSLVTCPLLMKEIGNSLHIDILPTCMVLGAFLLSRIKRPCPYLRQFCHRAHREHREKLFFLRVLCGKNFYEREWLPKLGTSPIKSNTPRMAFSVGVTLALACCVKAYVLVLLPWFWLTSSHKGSFSLGTFTTFIVMYLPWCWSGGTEIWTGTQYFSALWSMNDFFTALLREWFYHGHDLGRQSRFLYPIGEVWVPGVQSLSRQVGVLCFASLCVFFWIKRWFWLRQNPNSRKTIPLAHILAWTLLGVVWFAPVQNPWYLLWGLPFFLLSSHNMGLWIIALSPAYLFNFYFKATAHLFHPFQWWVIFPHVILLVVGWMSFNRHRINP